MKLYGSTTSPYVRRIRIVLSSTEHEFLNLQIGFSHDVNFKIPKEIKITNKTIFYDLNYSLGDTPFCEWAIENSNLVYDGIGMLAHQAALSFDIWFGVCPNIDTVIDDLESLKQ